MAICKECGKEVPEGYTLCDDCLGQELGLTQEPQPRNLTEKLYDFYQRGELTEEEFHQLTSPEKAKGVWILVSIFFPIVGIIFGAVSLSDGKKHAGHVYLWTGIVVLAVLILQIIFMIWAMMEASRA